MVAIAINNALTGSNTDPMEAHHLGYAFKGSKEQRCLDYVLQHATAGDIQSAIDAIDQFSEAAKDDWLMNVGPEKGAVLDAEVQKVAKQPLKSGQQSHTVLELGSYVGYSALRMVAAARAIGAGKVKLVCIDPSPVTEHVAQKIWQHAGITSDVTLLTGILSELLHKELPQLKQPVQLVFLDHQKDAYYSDVKLLEQHGLVEVGTAVVCDNMKGFATEDLATYFGIEDGSQKSIDYEVAMYDHRMGRTDSRDDTVVVGIRVTPVQGTA